MRGIEEEDSSVLLGKDENLPRGGSTSQGKHGVCQLTEAGGTLIGNRRVLENQPRFFFKTVSTPKPNLPFVLTVHREQSCNHSEEIQLFPVYILNFPCLTAHTDVMSGVEVENLRREQTVLFEKDPG